MKALSKVIIDEYIHHCMSLTAAASCPKKDLHPPPKKKHATDFCTAYSKKQVQKSQQKIGKKGSKKLGKTRQKKHTAIKQHTS
jgi:hypothetical protein